jgi:response regulator RpfG family c-di-GMP phosphodiesterase
MMPKILWVDDEVSLVESMKRQFRTEFDITAAYSGDAGLAAIGRSGPFAVIVSDQRMPGMDGIEFLSLARDLAPDAVRVMLTGYADQDTAIEAVNQGQIFRFLTKPCPTLLLQRTLRDCVRQSELVTAEREILGKTLTGSIEVLADVLALASPIAFRHAARMARYAGEAAELLKVPDLWRIRAAATMAHLGYITIPAAVLENFYAGRRLSPEEEAMMQAQVENTAKILSKIPRMEPVLSILREYERCRNTPAVQAREPVFYAANLLHAASEFDRLLSRGVSRAEAVRFLSSKPEEFNAEIVGAIAALKPEADSSRRRLVMVDQLENGMTVDEDVRTEGGMLLVPKGYVVNDTVRQRLRNFHRHGEIEGTVAVLCE